MPPGEYNSRPLFFSKDLFSMYVIDMPGILTIFSDVLTIFRNLFNSRKVTGNKETAFTYMLV